MLDLSNLTRPQLSIDQDRPIEYIALSWGKVGSDPLWMVELKFPRASEPPPA
jgi:hypothetical protein